MAYIWTKRHKVRLLAFGFEIRLLLLTVEHGFRISDYRVEHSEKKTLKFIIKIDVLPVQTIAHLLLQCMQRNSLFLQTRLLLLRTPKWRQISHVVKKINVLLSQRLNAVVVLFLKQMANRRCLSNHMEEMFFWWWLWLAQWDSCKKRW